MEEVVKEADEEVCGVRYKIHLITDLQTEVIHFVMM